MAQDSHSFPWFSGMLADLLARRELSAVQMSQMMATLMTGQCGEAEAAAFLVALRMKGESASEIAAAATIMRDHMVRWDAGLPGVLDTCGTGGDGTGTFNISTATAIVVAACGVPVVKHGNRSVSGRTGSADVLAELGVRVEGDAACARRCLERAGLAFCFAPQFHPALKNVAAVRRRLGVPTIFNCLGPLANPAGAEFQLLGVGRPEILDLMAGALARLKTRRALVVCGQDGLDEVSLMARQPWCGRSSARKSRRGNGSRRILACNRVSWPNCGQTTRRPVRRSFAGFWQVRPARLPASCLPTPPQRYWQPIVSARSWREWPWPAPPSRMAVPLASSKN